MLRRADALVAVAESYLAATPATEAGPPVELIVHVEHGSGTLDDGTALPDTTVERLACDAAVVPVVEDLRGNVLDVGRRRRTIPTRLRRALRLRDRGCRFPGCTNRHTDRHHVVPWSRGGPTTLANLCSLCRRHHVFVHELGFRLTTNEAGGFRFFAPGGLEVPAVGTPPALDAAPVEALCAQNRREGTTIYATTNLSGWDGRPADYDHIVFCLAAAAERTAAAGVPVVT